LFQKSLVKGDCLTHLSSNPDKSNGQVSDFQALGFLLTVKNGLRGELLNIFKLLRTFLNNLGAFMARGDVNPSFPKHGFGRPNNCIFPIIDILFS